MKLFKNLNIPLLVGSLALAATPAMFSPGQAADIPAPSSLVGTMEHIDYAKEHFDLRLGNGATYHVNANRAKILMADHPRTWRSLREGSKIKVFSSGMNILNRGLDATEIQIQQGPENPEPRH